ncbi:MAG: PAS domain S-box protein, partial [Thermomicrobiaceae bacterium]|nr:PAS domain S-box protein [Thermomicrobiaceae bacterium]
MERADLDLLADHVQAAGGRLTSLLEQATARGDPPGLLETAFEELRSMLEELQVAYEEIRVQNDELLQMQAALDRERQRYRELFEFAPDPYFVTDLHGVIQEANLAAAALLRLRARRLVGKPLAAFVDPSERARFRTDLLRLRHLGRLEDLALRLRPRKGGPVLASVTVEAVRADQGEPVGLRWLARDVTAQRELERQIRDLNADLERRVVERTEDLERARERLSFLAEASRALSESLDPPRILDLLAQLAVSRLADWSSVTIQERDGTLSRVALAHRDPAKAELLDMLRDRYAPDSAAARGVPRVLQTRQAELYPETPSDLIRDAVRTPEQRAALDRLGVGSLMIVPLVARGRVLGALSCVRSRGSASFSPDDLALAEELARRSALALDNALLYREAQRAIEARDEFLSVAAHELRNPATSLRGFAQLALRAVERGEQSEGALRHTLER